LGPVPARFAVINPIVFIVLHESLMLKCLGFQQASFVVAAITLFKRGIIELTDFFPIFQRSPLNFYEAFSSSFGD
jgi:hypothetical protein